MRTDKIYLVGFMGAGKSTVARRLGQRLDWRVEDLDDLIEAREHCTIAEVFAAHGEPYFRAAEREVLRRLLPLRHAVLATGGGTYADPDNRSLINADGVAVWLDLPFAAALSRVPADGRRPPRIGPESVRSGLSRTEAGLPGRPTSDSMRRRRSKNWLNEPWTGWDTRTVRYLVLSDIHANIDALEAVLGEAAVATCDRVVVLGDLVGYGAEPNGVVERVRALSPIAIIRGNHDKVAAGLASSEGFNPTAQQSTAWTQAAVTPKTLSYLAALPQGPLVLDELTEICHGSPIDEDTYIFGRLDAADALVAARRRVCLFGPHPPSGRCRARRGWVDRRVVPRER